MKFHICIYLLGYTTEIIGETFFIRYDCLLVMRLKCAVMGPYLAKLYIMHACIKRAGRLETKKILQMKK